MFSLLSWQIKAAIGAIVLVIITGLASWLAYNMYNRGYSAAEVKYVEAQEKANKVAKEKYDLIQTELEAQNKIRQEKTTVITNVVTKLVDRPIYKSVCIDSEGLDVINKAINGQ